MAQKLFAAALLALSLVACDSPALHQDRPGGSDYQPGAWRGGIGHDQDGDYRYDDPGYRDFCYRHPDQCRGRRY
jgi:hypothetical protein